MKPQTFPLAVSHLPLMLLRVARLLLHLAYGVGLALPYPHFDRARQRRILQHWSADLLAILNIRVTLSAKADLAYPQARLVVCNHVSWLDVFVLNAVIPTRFVAKEEVRHWPLIGWLCVRAQTLFIARDRMRSVARINGQLATLLQQGESLTVFPEGTTTDGASVAHFHAAPLQPAVDACCAVLPIALRYEDEHGIQSSAANYTGDTSLLESIWRLLNTPRLHACLLLTPQLDARNMERRLLARRAQQQVGTGLKAMHLAALLPERRYRPVQAATGAIHAQQHFRSLYSLLLYTTLSCPHRQ